MVARECGVVIITAPDTGALWQMVMMISPVPGGMSNT